MYSDHDTTPVPLGKMAICTVDGLYMLLYMAGTCRRNVQCRTAEKNRCRSAMRPTTEEGLTNGSSMKTQNRELYLLTFQCLDTKQLKLSQLKAYQCTVPVADTGDITRAAPNRSSH